MIMSDPHDSGMTIGAGRGVRVDVISCHAIGWLHRPSYPPPRATGTADRALPSDRPMPPNATPIAAKQFLDIAGQRMAFIDEGEGDAIVFQHGNPTSSYLWRNVMPHCRGLGRLIACDLLGMGDSDKLPDSGPDSYRFDEHSRYLDALWSALGLGERVVLVLHDWGSALGFDWANRHRDRIQGIAYMESIVTPLTWPDWPDNARRVFQNFRSEGEAMVLEKNVFVERVLPGSIMRPLTPAEMDEYRRPFVNPGEDRRPP